LNPEQYIAKAVRALESAAALLGKEDFEGSANRAYYAMFHAARAALASRNLEIRSRGHGTLVGQFGRHFITDGTFQGSWPTINEVQKLRHVGDYDAPTLARADAEEALQSAHEFVACADEASQATRTSSLIGPSPRP
jgi:uncharacterized protein (UPF0332 family)